LGNGHAFEGAHIVFLFATDLIANAEMANQSSAQIAAIEVAHGILFAVAAGRVMDSVLVEVSIAGVDVKLTQAGKVGQDVGQPIPVLGTK
jgi:hypothetical protein